MSVGRTCTRVVVTASPSESVLEVARKMADNNVGTVVILEPGQEPLAVVTDRDITVRCVAQGLDPERTPISGVMTSDVRTVDEDTPIEQALASMASAGIRRLVVTGLEGKLAGILSMDDVVELLAEETESIRRLLRKEAPQLAVKP